MNNRQRSYRSVYYFILATKKFYSPFIAINGNHNLQWRKIYNFLWLIYCLIRWTFIIIYFLKFLLHNALYHLPSVTVIIIHQSFEMYNKRLNWYFITYTILKKLTVQKMIHNHLNCVPGSWWKLRLIYIFSVFYISTITRYKIQWISNNEHDKCKE